MTKTWLPILTILNYKKNVSEGQSVFYVYLLTDKPHGTLYTGMTNNLMRRIWEHKNKINEGFSKRYGLYILVYFEIFKSPMEAIVKEKRIKKWKRQWKIELIEAMNPHWKDLSEGWY